MARGDRYVVPADSGWAVKREVNSRGKKIYGTRREAVNAAREYSANTGGGEVRVMGRNGKVTSSETVEAPKTTHYVLGTNTFSYVAAIEGIVAKKGLQKDLNKLRESSISNEKKRDRLASKYGIKK